MKNRIGRTLVTLCLLGSLLSCKSAVIPEPPPKEPVAYEYDYTKDVEAYCLDYSTRGLMVSGRIVNLGETDIKLKPRLLVWLQDENFSPSDIENLENIFSDTYGEIGTSIRTESDFVTRYYDRFIEDAREVINLEEYFFYIVKSDILPSGHTIYHKLEFEELR